MAFADPEVSVVLAATGGDHSADLLPHLDYDLIRGHRKVFQGYSDVTVLHWAFLKFAGLCTFHGPALLPELGEFPGVLPYTDRYLRAAWFGAAPLRPEPAEEWTDEMLDWFQRLDQTRPRHLHQSEGWVTVREGLAEGPLIGGCLETISRHLTGSDAWLPIQNALLFLETSEEGPSPEQVDEYLEAVAQLGTFERVSVLMVGRPHGYDEETRQALWEVIERRTGKVGVPALANVDLGHTDPMLTLPMGALARLDATRRSLTVPQVATSSRARRG